MARFVGLMRTFLDCVPCFFRQALEAARLAGASPAKQHRVLCRLADALPVFSLAGSPPEMGKIIYGIVSGVTGREDPYARIKRESNRKALSFYPRLKARVERSRFRLRTAAELAIAGNLIDYGVKNGLDVDKELDRIWQGKSRRGRSGRKALFQYGAFRRSLRVSGTVLYLADNAGETVFDRILIEEIRRSDPRKRIFYAVKAKPAINDALAADAKMCGLDRSAAIITNGSGAPGTVLASCSPAFRRLFRNVDLVISKGQGNFESLTGVRRPVFFLFVAKCPVVAKHVGCEIGEKILRREPAVRIYRKGPGVRDEK